MPVFVLKRKALGIFCPKNLDGVGVSIYVLKLLLKLLLSLKMKTLFRIAALFSAIFWIALTVGTFGMALIYVLLGYLFYLFVRSAFILHLKGSRGEKK